jgi:hypothetical protein
MLDVIVSGLPSAAMFILIMFFCGYLMRQAERDWHNGERFWPFVSACLVLTLIIQTATS